MKKPIDTIITVVAILVLLGMGYYFLNQNNERANEEEPTFIEIIDGEEVVLEKPLTESFSNKESNREVNESQKSSTLVATNSKNKVSEYVQENLVRPFTLGFYYFKNLTGGKNIQDCMLLNHSTSLEDEDIEYNEENFRLTDIQVTDKEVYMFVDADEVPETLCAQVINFKTFTSDIANAIHIIVN